MIFLKKIHGNIILSLNVLKRWLLQKNSTGVWSVLSYFLKRWYFFFPKMWSYSLDGKWKMIFLQKIHGNMIFPLNAPKSRSSKKIVLEYDRSYIIWKAEKMVFFSGKYDTFLLDRKWKMIFLKKYVDIWYFLYICMNVTNMILPFRQKKKKKKKSAMILSRKKIHLRVIDILDHILVISYPQFLSIQMRYPSPRDPLSNIRLLKDLKRA